MGGRFSVASAMTFEILSLYIQTLEAFLKIQLDQIT